MYSENNFKNFEVSSSTLSNPEVSSSTLSNPEVSSSTLSNPEVSSSTLSESESDKKTADYESNEIKKEIVLYRESYESWFKKLLVKAFNELNFEKKLKEKEGIKYACININEKNEDTGISEEKKSYIIRNHIINKKQDINPFMLYLNKNYKVSNFYVLPSFISYKNYVPIDKENGG